MPMKIREKRSRAAGTLRSTTWQPKAGNVTEAFLDHLKEIGRSKDVRNRIRDEAIAVLGGSVKPFADGRRTGLVIGRVQSGKTTSFTAVSALANDNGFKLVIVIAGTTQLLVEQTSERLHRDLRLDGPTAYKHWSVCPLSDGSKAKREAAMTNLRTRLRGLCATGKQLYSGIPLVIVMKNRAALEQLNELLREVRDVQRLDLSKLPALIIDDEAHMHSPNVGKDEKENASIVYDQIRQLTAKFPHSSLLQYTATPQANLLMEIQSELSPDFVRLLEPGPGYVGGRELFTERAAQHLREIPTTEYLDDAAEQDPPPPSLLAALANYLLVSTVDYLRKNEAVAHSLLVHSDHKTAVHKVFAAWINNAIGGWRMLLDAGTPVLSIPEFKAQWRDLAGTLPIAKIKTTAKPFRDVLRQVVANVRLQTVNSKSDVGKVTFPQAPYWIINGGNILGVGYTIEGLVTTHMMRQPGIGMADTIQQRGRFFGYKADQLAEIRIFVTSEMAKRFKDYAEHEEGLRRSLGAYDESRREYDPAKGTLKEWKRSFWLDRAMTPTRHKAQRLVLERARIDDDGWIIQGYISPTTDTDAANKKLVDELVAEFKKKKAWNVSDLWGASEDSDATRHLEAKIGVERLLKFLASFTFPAVDQGDMSAAMLAIDAKRESGASVVLMGGAASNLYGGDGRDYRRKRAVDKDGSVVKLSQGPSKGTGGYVGDRKVALPDCVTLQIHMLDLYKATGSRAGTKGKPFRAASPILAIRLPPPMREWAQNVLTQP